MPLARPFGRLPRRSRGDVVVSRNAGNVAGPRSWSHGRSGRSGVRLSGLLAALSLGTPGHGPPDGTRASAELHCASTGGADGPRRREREVVYYSSLLAWVGCHMDAYEQAKWFGDDLALKHEIRFIDGGRPWSLRDSCCVESAPGGRCWNGRDSRLASPVTVGGARGHVRQPLADRRRSDGAPALGEEIRSCVAQTFERWDGKGDPEGAKGEELGLPTRLVNLADVVEVFHHGGGVDAAVVVARSEWHPVRSCACGGVLRFRPRRLAELER